MVETVDKVPSKEATVYQRTLEKNIFISVLAYSVLMKLVKVLTPNSASHIHTYTIDAKM